MKKEVVYKDSFQGNIDSIEMKYDLDSNTFTIQDSGDSLIMELDFAKGLSKALVKFISDVEKDLKK